MMFSGLFFLFFVVQGDIIPSDVIQIPSNIVSNITDNEKCKGDSRLYEESLNSSITWAYKMLDSSAKGTFGILEGNSFQFGSYGECLDISGPFDTQYCLVSIFLKVPITNASGTTAIQQNTTVFDHLKAPKHNRFQKKNVVRFGLCFPSSCTASDVKASLTHQLAPNQQHSITNITYDVATDDAWCASKSKARPLGVAEIFFCGLSLSMVLLLIIGTFADVQEKKSSFAGKTFLLIFSTKNGLSDLFRSRQIYSETKVFNGVRTLSLLVVMLTHKFEVIANGPLMNSDEVEKISRSKWYYIIEKSDLAVDTFFVLSGLLLTYGLLKRFRTSDVNPVLLVLLRYFRLTPLYAYLIFYFATLLDFSGSGPIWSLTIHPQVELCKHNWWTNLLYINNYLSDQQCMSVSWYLACDFQFFVVAVIVLFIIRTNAKLGHIILTLLFLSSIAVPFAVTLAYRVSPAMGLQFDENFKRYITLLYVKSHNRAGAYIVGMYGGFLYDMLTRRQKKITPVFSGLILGLSTLFITIAIVALSVFYNGFDDEHNALESALYNALHRVFWAIGVVGVFVVASFGHLTAVTAILSAKLWEPLSKLCYGVYLTHLVLLNVISGKYVAVRCPSSLEIITSFLGEAVLSFTVAAVLYVAIEVPFKQILKIFLTGSKADIEVGDQKKPIL